MQAAPWLVEGKYPADADVWSFRQAWAQEKNKLKEALAAGRFRFGLLTRITLKDGETIDLWSASDALVLKALAIVLATGAARRRAAFGVSIETLCRRFCPHRLGPFTLSQLRSS